MTNIALPIIISILSFVLAAISLGWNVYRDVVLKPRARVTVAKAVVASELLLSQDVLIISAVNLGPGRLRLNIIRFMHRSLLQRILRKWRHGVLIHDYRNRLSGQLPATLEVGDSLDLLFPWGAELICASSPTHIGIKDSFGRTHWAAKSDVAKVNKEWSSEFHGAA